jgi:hypothetical protein
LRHHFSNVVFGGGNSHVGIHVPCEDDYGAIVIQLTSELKDIAAEEAAFERARQDARNHLNNDAFFDPAKGLDYQYRVPEFVWGAILH